MNKIKQIIKENKKIVGIWGYPTPQSLFGIRKKYPQHEIVDLDVNYEMPDSGLLPDAYCRIIKNIIDNALALKNNLEVVIASVGEEKCDSGRFAAIILKDLGFNIIETRFNESSNNFATPVSTSNLPLREKVLAIMDSVIAINTHSFMLSKEKQPSDKQFKTSIPNKTDFSASPPNDMKLLYTQPKYGFWGVPPNDLGILDLFPNTTHVYGWTRCVEAGRPADIELEMFVDKDVPTVFFAQTFCAKMQLARYLAKKHDGLYVDLDDKASNSVKAKIEAFIKLR